MSAKTRSTSAKWLGPGLGLGLGLGLGGKRGRDGAPLQRAGGWTPACLYLDIFSPWRPAHGRGVCLYRRREGDRVQASRPLKFLSTDGLESRSCK